MGRYVLRRLLQLIPVFIGTTLIIYVLVWAVPGNPFAGKCGDRPCPDSYIQAMTEKYNLDDPVIVQYFQYMGNLLTGDFGENYQQIPIAELIADAYPETIKLALLALAFEALIGLAAGILTGLRGRGFLDNLVLVSTLLVIALPVFVTGFLLQIWLGVKWGIVSPTVGSNAPLVDYIVPAIALAALSTAYVSRLMRTGLQENMRADYMRTAKAKGLTEGRSVGVHLLRNSLIPVVTFLGTDLGALMGGAIITEGIFNINGIGGLVFRSIVTKDTATVVAVVTLLVLVYLLMNVLVDVLYAVLDPRIRYD